MWNGRRPTPLRERLGNASRVATPQATVYRAARATARDGHNVRNVTGDKRTGTRRVTRERRDHERATGTQAGASDTRPRGSAERRAERTRGDRIDGPPALR